MTFITEQGRELRGDVQFLALVGERVRILGAPVTLEIPRARRPLECVANVEIHEDGFTPLSPGFAVLNLRRGNNSLQCTWVCLPASALDSEASRAFRDRYDNHATMPPKNPAKMREALAAAVSRDVTRESLAAALAVDPSGVCGELVGKPGHGFPVRAYGAPTHVTPLDVKGY